MLAKLEPGDLATWVGAVGTLAGFLAVAIQFGWGDFLRRRESRVKQAEAISGWILGSEVASDGELQTQIIVSNSSNQPVYSAFVSLVTFKGDEPVGKKSVLSEYQVRLSVLPPGQYKVLVAGDWGGMNRHPAVELAFRDSAGRYWIRQGSGKLSALKITPREHYGLDLPCDWSLPGHDLGLNQNEIASSQNLNCETELENETQKQLFISNNEQAFASKSQG